jgi:hypothetical protein
MEEITMNDAGTFDRPGSPGTGVLVVAAGGDDFAGQVVERLRSQQVPVVWADPGRPEVLEVSEHLVGGTAIGTVRVGDPDASSRELAVEQVWQGWYHPPAMPVYAQAGARLGLGWSLLEPVWLLLPRWLNQPADLALAACRPVQLQRAQAAGLPIAATVLTTSPQEARDFQRRTAGMTETPLTWPVGGPVGTIDDPALLESMTHPHLLQAPADGIARIRLTAVNDHLSAVRLETTESGQARPAVQVAVPSRTRGAVHDLLAGLGLRFAVLDFAESSHGSWIFLGLDALPRGVLEQAQAGVDVAALVADALADAHTRPQ